MIQLPFKLPGVAAYSAALLFLCIQPQGCTRGSHRSVAVIPRLSSDAHWLSFHVGIMEAAEKAGLGAHWSGPSEDSNSAEQIELAEEAIDQRVYGIILEPRTLVATNRVIRKAAGQRIPVVIIAEGSGMPEGEHIYHLLNDTNETGRLIAQRVKEIVHGDGEVAILGLRSEIPGNIERADAIGDALKRSAPDLEITKKSMESYSISYEQLEAGEFIRSHPRLKVIVALNSQETFAVAAAVRSENAMQRIKIIGCDQTLALFLMLRAGALDSMVVQDMRSMGRQAIDILARDRNGLPAPAVTVVKPLLLTTANIDTEAVQQAILMHKESPR